MDYIQENWWQLICMLPLVICVLAGLVIYIIEAMKNFPLLLIPLVIIILAMIGSFNIAKAETFVYKNKLTIEAPDYTTAAKLCFKTLNPVYTTEEAGLDTIDICTNPLTGEVK